MIGAGAVGQFLAARLMQGGHDVVMLARPSQADALNARGMTLQVGAHKSGIAVKAAAGFDDRLLQTPFETVIIAVKSYSTPEAAAALTDIPACGGASILSVQNGVGNEDILAERFGPDRVVAGALTVAVERTDSTSIVATARGGLCIAPLGADPHNWLIAGLSHSLPVRAAADWRALKWSKLCINILGNAVCAALDWLPAQVYDDRAAFAVERAALLETVAVMSALRIKPINLLNFPAEWLIRGARMLPPSMLRAVLRNRVARARGGKLPSLLMDLRAGRARSEVSTLNGAVALHALQLGIRAPANTTLAEVVTGIASGVIAWSDYRGDPQRLVRGVESRTDT